MHILLIHQVFVRPQDPGGTRHYDFARHMVQNGHRVTVLAGTRSYLSGARLKAAPREQPIPGLEIVRCGVLGGPDRGFVWRTVGYFSFILTSLWRGIRVRGVHVVWGTSPPLFQGWTAWLLARLKKTPELFEVRGLWPEFAIQVGALRSRTLIALSRWLEGFLYRRADQIVVNSPGFLPHLERFDLPEQHITLIPNGVNLDWDSNHDGSLLRGPHGLKGKYVALYAGAIGMANDLGQLIEAARMLRQDPRIVLLFVGEGAQKAELETVARRDDLSNVMFLPPVQKAQMPHLLGEVDCGIATLKPIPIFNTTYPNKVFDYMAASLPVVLAIDGAIRSVVEQAQSGLYVEPGDSAGLAKAIKRMADDPELTRTLGQNGRRYVAANFARADMAQQMQRTLEALAG